MPTGIVKAFYRSKGYGFIRAENDRRDVFVHRSAIDGGGLKDLRKGQRVVFELEDGDRLAATKVYVVDNEHDSSEAALATGQPGEGDPVVTSKVPAQPNRKPVTSAVLERSIAAAVRKGDPECEAFVGVIVEAVSPTTADAPNWALKGVRYGRANRDKCEIALDAALREKQRRFALIDLEGA
jgi:cold shock CspA family protein